MRCIAATEKQTEFIGTRGGESDRHSVVYDWAAFTISPWALFWGGDTEQDDGHVISSD